MQNVTFLSLNKKVTKEVSQRGVGLCAISAQIHPFGFPRHALDFRVAHLGAFPQRGA